MKGFARWGWLLLIPLVIGLACLRFDVEVLNLLPDNLPEVHGLKLYQQHFANARELIVTVTATNPETAETVTAVIGSQLQAETNLFANVVWQPPWLEHPEQMPELIAHLWLNQPPEVFDQLARHLAETNLPAVLAATRDQLATTLSPTDIAQLSYDPFGLTRLPRNVAGAAPNFAEGRQLFASADGRFRIIFAKARGELAGYRECTSWLDAVKERVQAALKGQNTGGVSIGYTGRPAFVAEISGSMKRDITLSVGGTAAIIAVLFWLAHRRVKPMLWLLTLLALILGGTLALGGLIFSTINVVSMGFAAILLGLAVDYAVVHYQEALAHPNLSVPQIRRAIAPSIFWAAVTTITAFLVLNFGGLPGLAQLGSLVGVGVALSALVMIFAFLPPLFPERCGASASADFSNPRDEFPSQNAGAPKSRGVFIVSTTLILLCVVTLLSGLPGMDATPNALRPRGSQAYATLDAIRANLGQNRDPLWLIVAGRDESEVARKLDAVEPVLRRAVTNGALAEFTMPTMLWPRPEFQSANRRAIQKIVARHEVMRAAVLAEGFSEDAMALTDHVLNTWQQACSSTNVFWPTNEVCSWIFEKLVARESKQFFAVGFLFPATNAIADAGLAKLVEELPHEGTWLSSWERLGGSLLATVKSNQWKLLLPMAVLVLLSLWLAFRRFAEIALSLGTLLFSGLVLLTVMKFAGWSWNLLNLMAVPLILGTGVDYSLFMQLALRRHYGDLRVAHCSVGRALLLCGGTAVAGFGSLGLSSNAGMASLGQVCAVGIAANMLISVFLLPSWWSAMSRGTGTRRSSPSSLYGAKFWQLGLIIARWLPARVCELLARLAAAIYWIVASHRREVVIQNILPVLSSDRVAAERTARRLFANFAIKVAHLWHFESGTAVDQWMGEWNGWERFQKAHERGRGVLLVTPHLGNWEFGGPFMVKKGCKLLVLTQAEPDKQLTELRQASRAQWGVETLVVGNDPFAFVEIIKRLNEGATVALLVDRPPAPTTAKVELFGRPFAASIAVAELARASGCAIVPVYVVLKDSRYAAQILPEISYDRAAIGSREARVKLTQEILRAFEPVIRQYPEQWYHFVPIWPRGD